MAGHGYGRKKPTEEEKQAWGKWWKQLETVKTTEQLKEEQEADEEYQIRKAAEEAAEAKRQKKEELLRWKAQREAEARRKLFCSHCGAEGDHPPSECPELAKLRAKREQKAAAMGKTREEDVGDTSGDRRGGKPVLGVPKRSKFLDDVSDRDRTEEALKMAIDESTRAYGRDHRDTQECVRRLAQFYKRRGDLGECEVLFRTMADEREEESGPFGVALLNPLKQLALVLEERKNYEEAYYTYERIYDCERFCKKPKREQAITTAALNRLYILMGGTKEGVPFP